MKPARLAPVACLAAAVAAPVAAQIAAPRDPAAVELRLKLGAAAVIDEFGAVFDRLAVGGAIPVIGPETTLEIRAAADRARVFLAFTQYDLDGNGAVSRAEFDLHTEMSWGDTLAEAEYQLLDAEWAAADANGDDNVTHSEMLGLALEMHPVPRKIALGAEGKAMLLMDLDNDGFVIWDEVEAVLRAPR